MSTVNILHLFVVHKRSMELSTLHKLCGALVAVIVCSHTLWLTFNNLHLEPHVFKMLFYQTGGAVKTWSSACQPISGFELVIVLSSVQYYSND